MSTLPPTEPTIDSGADAGSPEATAAAPARKRSASAIAWLAVAIATLFLVFACGGLAYFGYQLWPKSAPATPAPTPTPPVVSITSIKKIAELATVEAGLVTDVEVTNVPEDLRKRLGFRERLVMIVHGTAKAGFDLEKIKDEDLWVDGSRVQLYLPSPEVLSLELDFDKSRVVDYDRTLTVAQDPNLQAEALELAQERLKQAVLESNILPMAEEYARVYFENHLRSLGFDEIKIEFR